jgi:DNA polymerase I
VKKLFLLDGMPLVYRGHFALANRPIFNSQGINTSALFVFTQTLLDILKSQSPSHIAVAFDTSAPTQRHADFPDYKIQRQAMPEDITWALPQVRRMLEAFNIPMRLCDGYEADDLIGTLVRKAEHESFTTYMVTPDKDFGQLISEKTFLYRPSRMGDAVEIFGLPEIRQKWGIQEPKQIIDILALWGDASDNIPGVPGIGEKTGSKLIAQYGSVENLLEHLAELKGKLKENLQTYREQALLSKKLATIDCDAPCDVDLDSLKIQPANEEKLRELLREFEFNTIGRRLFGDDFKAARQGAPLAKTEAESQLEFPAQTEFAGFSSTATEIQTITDVAHNYQIVTGTEERVTLLKSLRSTKSFCFSLKTDRPDPREAKIIGLAFSWEPHRAFYLPMPGEPDALSALLQEFRSVFANEAVRKVGHDLKFDIHVLKRHGIEVRGNIFDILLAHSLIEPDLRHNLPDLAEMLLRYSPIPIARFTGDKNSGPVDLSKVPPDLFGEYAAETADLAWRLQSVLAPLLEQKGQKEVFYDIEAPLLPVLAEMEYEGVRVDAAALDEFAKLLSAEMATLEKTICSLAGHAFNLNSPRQLGDVLFDVLKICENPKRTKSGQYATDEQTLLTLAPEHEIVRSLLEYRTAAKLKSTYADTLPLAISPATGRIHTTYNQVMTATGRLSSNNPNLQNIPIRTEHGREIRKAFIPRGPEYLLLSADYSQIELRIIASLTREPAMVDAFQKNLDVHTATAARVFGVALDEVTPEMRRKSKMVNYGIAYGISAFGLAQRLAIPRKEAAAIIEQYFEKFPGIRKYMAETIATAKTLGYVETMTGRRRYLRDIRSSNASIRSAAERNAINAPIQGTAADMIKIAMARIHHELRQRNLKTRMLLQVHDELVFDLFEPEKEEVLAMVEEKMKNAIALEVPVEVEAGTGKNWLEAH